MLKKTLVRTHLNVRKIMISILITEYYWDIAPRTCRQTGNQATNTNNSGNEPRDKFLKDAVKKGR